MNSSKNKTTKSKIDYPEKFFPIPQNILLTRIFHESTSERCQTSPSIESTFPKCFVEYLIRSEKPERKNQTHMQIQYQCLNLPKPRTATNRYHIKDNNPYHLNELPMQCVLPVTIDKYFKKKKSNTTEKTPPPIQGKKISNDLIEKIEKNEKILLKLEKKHFCVVSPNLNLKFDSSFYVQNYMKKIRKTGSYEINSNSLISPSLLTNTLSEENFFNLISNFYQKKIIKSKELMKYFIGKDNLYIVNHIGKYLFNNLFTTIETNISSLDYIENIHKKMNISNKDFDIFKGLFIINMRENGFSENNTQILNTRLEKYRGFIVKNIKIEQLCDIYQGNLDNYLSNVHENIKENGVLSALYFNISDQNAIYHHRKLFSDICIGYSHISMLRNKKQNLKDAHKKLNIGWRECFEMKNILLNNLLMKDAGGMTSELELFRENLQQLHKFILLKPNNYENIFDGQIDVEAFIKHFSNGIQNCQILKKLFEGWKLNRIQEHCKYICEFVCNNDRNIYQLEDLVPAHCKVFINRKEFNSVQKAFHTSLCHINTNKENNFKIMTDFERVRYFISREKTLYEKIGGNEILNCFLDNIYVNLFGSEETKAFYANSDIEYVKFKQKLFFTRLLESKIDRVDLVDLKAIHNKMCIKSNDFDLFVKHSQSALSDLKINDKLKGMFIEKIEALKPYICQ